MTSWTTCLFLYYTKQVALMLQSVCSVIDHRWHQNMVRTSVIHSPKGFCHFFVLTTFWSRSWSKTENNAQQHGIYLLNIKTLTFPCLSTSPPLVLRNMTFLGCRICAILIAALLASTHSTWPDGHSPTAVKTGICPDLGGRGELKVSEWIKLLPEVYCPYVKALFSNSTFMVFNFGWIIGLYS